MSKKNVSILLLVIVLSIAFFLVLSGRKQVITNAVECNIEPALFPDYSQIVIPPNIAPLNFIIKEENTIGFHVKIYSKNGKAIEISCNESHIKIPAKEWKNLLECNKGEDLCIDICTKGKDGVWNRFKSIKNKIAEEEIDSYLVYRLINPGYRLWENMGIFIRNIENFNEKPIILNNLANKNCMNCHSFCNNNPEKALFHVRGNVGGTILVNGGTIKKINTETAYTMSAGVYPAWHPDGKYIAFSVNRISQEFYSAGTASIKVFDNASDLILYNSETDVVTTSPKISSKDFENMPTWSPDGKYLYFCSAPIPEADHAVDSVKYCLMRISYDTESNTWGDVDTILSSSESGQSISWPRISPDGKFILFCMTEYGYFPVYDPGSTLYLMDLLTHEFKELPVNSAFAESYHSWSSNGRWFVFSSKRMNGLCSRPYFCYFDKKGTVYKPFIMPLEDPSLYEVFLKSYNIPEFLTSPLKVSKWNLYRQINSEAIKVEFDKKVEIDALSGATKIKKGNVKY